MLLKGPKAVLSEAIAHALDKYFIIDAEHNISSNLLTHARILLTDVELRPRTLTLNEQSGSTTVTLTGSVETVELTWSWTTFGETWMKDAALTIHGCKFLAALACGETKEVTQNDAELSPEAILNPVAEKTDASTKTEIKKVGGISAYIQKHVEKVLDSLRVRLEDVKLSLELPPALREADPVNHAFSFVLGGDVIELVSLGRTMAAVDSLPSSATGRIEAGRKLVELLSSTSDDRTTSEGDGKANLIHQTLSVSGISLQLLSKVTSEGDHEIQKNPAQPRPEAFTILEPFSYRAHVIRAGKRFNSVSRGLQVVGEQHENEDRGLVVYLDAIPLQALRELGELVVSAVGVKDEADKILQNENGVVQGSVERAAANLHEGVASVQSNVAVEEDLSLLPSSVDFVLSSAKLVLFQSKSFEMKGAGLQYVMDGSVCLFQSEEIAAAENTADQADCEPELHDKESAGELSDGGQGLEVFLTGFSVKLKPQIVVSIHAVTKLRVPNVFALTKPALSDQQGEPAVTIALEGKTVMISANAIEGCLLDNKTRMSSDGNGPTAGPLVPCPVAFSAKQALVYRERNPKMSLTQLKNVNLFLKPETGSTSVVEEALQDEPNSDKENDDQPAVPSTIPRQKDDGSVLGTSVALSIHEIRNPLVQVSDAKLACLVPVPTKAVAKVEAGSGKPNAEGKEIESFRFAADEIRLQSGHSADEWIESFDITAIESSGTKDKKANKLLSFMSLRKSGTNGTSKGAPLLLPYCEIASLDIQISVQTGVGVSIKNTGFRVNPFKGKANTTSKDLISHYIATCLGRVPGFITNAEVLGVNVVDSAGATYGAVAGQAAVGAVPIGPAIGVGVVTAFDAVKGAVAAGKRSRAPSQSDANVVTDFFRGLSVAAKESAQEGHKRRGKSDSDKADVVDWAVGATSHTGSYVGENKSRLGGAGGAGVGVVVGSIVGGPIGGIVGGVLGGAVTQKTIEKVEDEVSKPRRSRKGPDVSRSFGVNKNSVRPSTGRQSEGNGKAEAP